MFISTALFLGFVGFCAVLLGAILEDCTSYLVTVAFFAIGFTLMLLAFAMAFTPSLA